MGIFSKKKNERELALVFDIGSSSVGGSIFEVHKGGVPKILRTFRENILLEESIDTERFLFLTIKSLESVASRLSTSLAGRPNKIFCVLSSPFYASATRTIKLEKNVPFLFTPKIADELIKKEVNLFEEENLAKFSQTDDKVRLIEFKNIKTTLNGYMTSMPFNKKTQKIEMMIFISMSGDLILKKFEEAIFKHFHSKNIIFSSFVMASFAIARDLFIKQEDFLLVDIAGEMTDISIIKKNTLNASSSYPLGRNFIIRKTRESLGCTLSEAKSFISLYKDGHAGESIEKKLKPIINKLKVEWLKGFQESLVALSSDISIPSNIFITVDQDLADFFGDTIKSEQFHQYALTESKFKVTFLNTEILHGLATFESGVVRDPFLTIESIYINRFIC